MGIVVAPILEGKEVAHDAWVAELKGARRADFEDFNKRYGLTRHAAWKAQTPMGPVVVALHEGPGADTMMQKLASSTESFDMSFAAHIKDVHGLDLNAPPPGPMPELLIDSAS